MPMNKVEVMEYECIQCRYKWINRVNGVDGAIPKRCAKCKKLNWNRRITTPEEIGFRRRIGYLKTLYRDQTCYWGLRDNYKIDWPEGLIEKFLNLDPRPTIADLERVLHAPVIRLDSQNQYTRRGYVPHPSKPRVMTYDEEEYKKLLKQGAEKQQNLMLEIINSRPH
jgi:hypothetical protein